MKTKNKINPALSPAALLLAAACVGIGSAYGQTTAHAPSNDPLHTIPMPITNRPTSPSGLPQQVASIASETSYTAQVASAAPASGQYSTTPPTPATVVTTTAPAPVGTTDKLKFSDKRFVKKIAEGGQLEIAMAELAVQRATDPAVRAYAQDIVNDHAALSRQLDLMAARKGFQSDVAEYTPKLNSTSRSLNGDGTSTGAVASTGSTDVGVAGAPTGRDPNADMSKDWNDPTTDRHYRRLAAKNGAEFDHAFVAAMVSDHEEDIAMFDKKAQNADDADVRSLAADTLPKLRQHLARAQELAGSTKSN